MLNIIPSINTTSVTGTNACPLILMDIRISIISYKKYLLVQNFAIINRINNESRFSLINNYKTI